MDAPLDRLRTFVASLKRGGQTDLARRLGVTQPTLSKVLAGDMPMNLKIAAGIERETEGWEGGQILAVDWAPAPASSDSGTHAAVDVNPAAEPEPAAGNA